MMRHAAVAVRPPVASCEKNQKLLSAKSVSTRSGVQGASAPALRLAASGGAKEFIPSRRLALSQRIAAGLLAIAVACMAAARYA